MKTFILMMLFVESISCSAKQSEVIDVVTACDVEATEFEAEVGKEAINLDALPWCGLLTYCLDDFVCVDNKVCCPTDRPDLCGDSCVSAACNCVTDVALNIELCVDAGAKYCGHGVVCSANEECVQKNDATYCLPTDAVDCGGGRWCDEHEICTEHRCCPVKQPLECGATCCYPLEVCHADDSTCVPKEAVWCNGQVCESGKSCAGDGLPVCYPTSGAYCGNGQSCPSGFVCNGQGGCCAQEMPQFCGGACCPAYYDCVAADGSERCLPPGTKVCGIGWCEPGYYCADASFSLCLKVGQNLCSDGHVCDIGFWCAGPTCCPQSDPQQQCGALCCAKTWQCINSGEACIPPNAVSLGNGQFCPPGTFYNAENDQCDLAGWQPCGDKSACPPGSACVEDEHQKKCCPADQQEVCGDSCCYSGFGCVEDGDEDVCLPPGATYCYGKNVNKWCPPGTFCGQYGKNCIPYSAKECPNGDFCSAGNVCTGGEPPCCPDGLPIPCINLCCGYGDKCVTLNGTLSCIPKDATICSSIFGDTVCLAGTFCEIDGGCVSNEFLNQPYEYCGGGEVCPANDQCGGLCAEFCCAGGNTGDLVSVYQDCFSGTIMKKCIDTGDQVFCNGSFQNAAVTSLIEEFQKKCDSSLYESMQCKAASPGGCTIVKPLSTACMQGCFPPKRICKNVPTSNIPYPEPHSLEQGTKPEQVEYEVGDYIPELNIVIAENYVIFHPAGLAVNYQDGVYRAENEPENWVQSDWPATEEYREMLVVERAWIIDNLEGIDCPHGPYAQLYWFIYTDGSLPYNLMSLTESQFFGKSEGEKNGAKNFLKGPLAGGNCWEICVCVGFTPLGWCYEECWDLSWGSSDTVVHEEWVRNLSVQYSRGQAGLHKWGKEENVVHIALKESDGGGAYGRYDDYAGFAVVNKQQTRTPCGQWVPLYKYESNKEDELTTNDDVELYYYKTQKIAAYLLLRTIVY